MKVKTVKWRDSNMYITQAPRDSDWQIAEVTSVGFVIDEDKKQITLAGDLIGEDVRRVIVIPKENIISCK